MITRAELRSFAFAALRRPSRLAKASILGAAVAVWALLLWLSIGHSPVIASHGESQPESAQPAYADSEYFPGKYKNQATEIPEHIQAF